jgi:hypothetical protein
VRLLPSYNHLASNLGTRPSFGLSSWKDLAKRIEGTCLRTLVLAHTAFLSEIPVC